MPDSQQSDTPELLRSGSQTPIRESWLPPMVDSQNIFGLPDLTTSSDSGANGSYFTGPGLQILADTPPYMGGDYEGQLDTTISDPSYLDQLDAWNAMDKNPAGQVRTGLANLHSRSASTPRASVPVSSQDTAQKRANACTCLQQNAEILSNPSVVEMNACNGSGDAALSLEKALSLARHAASVWRILVACPNCPYDKDQEVVMLAYMGIRAVTRYLQRLGPRYIARLGKDPDGTGPSPAEESVRLMVGSLEVEGEERIFVFRMLFQRMLQNVQGTLHSLQGIQCKQRRLLMQETSGRAVRTDDYQLTSSLLHIQQISHTLTISLKELESALNST